MAEDSISTQDNYTRKRISVLDTEMAYVDVGQRDPIVFLHGNPTSSYLWRNLIPRLERLARCLAPDLIGMGNSAKSADGSHRFVDHFRHLDAWLDSVGLTGKLTLVGHDWGSALGFHWAERNPDRIKGIAYMETIVQPFTWETWPEQARGVFQGMRSSAGEEMVLENNVFVERILPGSVLRGLTEEELSFYRRPYLEAGESRRPILTWPREIPVDGEPADMVEIVASYAQWLSSSQIPKLFVNADPGAILTGKQREFCRSWPNQQEVTVKGAHFIQEDSPDEIGAAIAQWYGSL